MFKGSKGRLIASASSVLFGILLYAIWTVLKPTLSPDLIIRYHYSGLKTLDTVITVISAAFTGFGGFLFGITYSKYRKDRKAYNVSKQQIEKTLAKESREASLQTPEGIYAYVEKLQNRHHNATVILKQLDRMNDYQARLEELFRVNSIKNLSDAKDLLQDIEDAICMVSVKRLINYYIISGETAFESHAERTIDDNNRLLDQANGVLGDIVEFINGDKSLDEVTAHIAAFRKTIQTFIKEENEDEKQFQKDFGTLTQSAHGR